MDFSPEIIAFLAVFVIGTILAWWNGRDNR